MRKKIFERLTEKAEVSEASKEYISQKAPIKEQGYHAGEEKGYQRGEVAGFAKGVAATLLLGAAAVVTAAIKGAIDFTKLGPKK